MDIGNIPRNRNGLKRKIAIERFVRNSVEGFGKGNPCKPAAVCERPGADFSYRIRKDDFCQADAGFEGIAANRPHMGEGGGGKPEAAGKCVLAKAYHRVRKHDARQAVAIGKGMHSDGFKTVWKSDARQIGTTGKSVRFNGFKTVRKGDVLQTPAIRKRMYTHPFQTSRPMDTFQRSATIESACTNGIDAIRQRDRGQGDAIGKRGLFNIGY